MFEIGPARADDAAVWQPSPLLRAESFRDYVRVRKYDFGRGRAASWAFIAYARGDADFPDIRSWPELRRYLERAQADHGLREGARSVWRSFTASRSVRRRRAGATAAGPAGAAHRRTV